MSGTKVSIKYGFGKPQAGSLKKAELAIDLKDLSLWTTESDGGQPVRVAHDTTELEGQVEQINIDIQGNAEAIVQLGKDIQVNADAIVELNKDVDLNAEAIVELGKSIELNADAIFDLSKDVQANADAIFELRTDVDLNAEAIAQLDKDAVKKNVASLQEMIGKLKAVGFVGDGSELSGITANQLDDVDTTAVKRDDFLIYNGTTWVAEDFHIDTELTYQGGIALASPAPAGPANGDLYINNADGVVHPSWTGISGKTVKAGNVVGWAANKARWFLLGDIASSSVTDVEGGLGISVDDSKPAEPVVSIDRVEVDKWYEPKFSKNTAFNKAFGTAAGTVAEGNHLHTGVYQPVGDYALKSYTYSKAESDAKYELKGYGYSKSESDGKYQVKGNYLTSFTETDPTVPAHVKSISTADIAKWNTPAPAAPVSSVNGKIGAVNLTYTDVGAVGIGAGGTVAAPKIVIGSTGSDPNTLYFVV